MTSIFFDKHELMISLNEHFTESGVTQIIATYVCPVFEAYGSLKQCGNIKTRTNTVTPTANFVFGTQPITKSQYSDEFSFSFLNFSTQQLLFGLFNPIRNEHVAFGLQIPKNSVITFIFVTDCLEKQFWWCGLFKARVFTHSRNKWYQHCCIRSPFMTNDQLPDFIDKLCEYVPFILVQRQQPIRFVLNPEKEYCILQNMNIKFETCDILYGKYDTKFSQALKNGFSQYCLSK
jgi:hypothetical protein